MANDRRLRLRSQTEGVTGLTGKKTKAQYQAEFDAKLNEMPQEDPGAPSDERYDTGFNEAQEGVKESERFGLTKHLSRSRLAALKRNLLRQYQAGKYGNDTPENFASKVNQADLNTKKPVTLKQDKIPTIDPRIDELKRQMITKRMK